MAFFSSHCCLSDDTNAKAAFPSTVDYSNHSVIIILSICLSAFYPFIVCILLSHEASLETVGNESIRQSSNLDSLRGNLYLVNVEL